MSPVLASKSPGIIDLTSWPHFASNYVLASVSFFRARARELIFRFVASSNPFYLSLKELTLGEVCGRSLLFSWFLSKYCILVYCNLFEMLLISKFATSNRLIPSSHPIHSFGSDRVKCSNLTPEDIKSSPSSYHIRRRLRISICDIDEMLNRYPGERNNLRLFDKLKSEVKDKDDRDIDIGRNKGFSVPLSMNEDNITTKEQEDRESNE